MNLAIYYQDPKIMSYALAPPHDLEGTLLSQEERSHLTEPDFTHTRHNHSEGVYGYLSPSRRSLYLLIEKRLEQKWTKQQIVRSIYNIFKDEILSLAKFSLENEVTPQLVNQRLLHSLDKAR